MPKREDFEIYQVDRNGHTWYGFNVEYFGKYSAPTEEQILKLRRKIKRKVKARLEWVAKENAKYFARVADQERQRVLSLKKAREQYKNPEGRNHE